jgi:hypothetical protein
MSVDEVLKSLIVLECAAAMLLMLMFALNKNVEYRGGGE